MSEMFDSAKCPESYFVGKFLEPENEQSILRSWLQNRLTEHNAKIERLMRIVEERLDFDFDSFAHSEDVDVCFDELKVLKIFSSPELAENDYDDCEECIIKGIPTQCKDALYETAEKRLTLSIQRKGASSAVETLHLCLQVGEVSNLNLLNQIVHPFVAYSEKHSIDVFNLVFPVLEGWAKMRQVGIKLAVPMCYFGKYDDQQEVELFDIVEESMSTKDDIMSKVAAGMKTAKKHNDDVVIESHRILILNDIRKEGYTRKNFADTSFLALLNVRAALREMAKIHAVSWAFSKNTGKHLHQHWPFLECNKQISSYLMSLLKSSFPIAVNLSADYLKTMGAPDFPTIMQHLRTMKEHLGDILKKVDPANGLNPHGPVTLIHQGLNFTSVLFRHSIVRPREAEAEASAFKELISSASNVSSKDSALTVGGTDEEPTVSRKSSTCNLVKREVCISDWKCASVGSPLFDVALLLLSSLPPKTRKSETLSLLVLYWEEFEATVSLFGFTAADMTWKSANLMADYGKGLLYGCLLIASNIKSEFPVHENDMEIFVEGIRDLIALKII